MAKHRLVLQDLGIDAPFRWHPTCACGWTAIWSRRIQRDAETMYHDHVATTDQRTHHPVTGVPRRRPTPLADLPDVLR